MYPIQTQTFTKTFQQSSKRIGKAIEILVTFKGIILHISHKFLIFCLKFGRNLGIILFIFLILVGEIQRRIVLKLSHSLFLKLSFLSLFFLHQLLQQLYQLRQYRLCLKIYHSALFPSLSEIKNLARAFYCYCICIIQSSFSYPSIVFLSIIFFYSDSFLDISSIFFFYSSFFSSCAESKSSFSSSIPSSASSNFRIPKLIDDWLRVWYAAKVILCSSLTLIRRSPRSGQLMVTSRIIQSRAWLNNSSLMGQIPQSLAWRCSKAWSRDSFNLTISDLYDF